ncbi:hypothetical protein BpHYR1_022975, partial [Brachionus plicatilis]
HCSFYSGTLKNSSNYQFLRFVCFFQSTQSDFYRSKKANSIPYHFADWRKFSFLEMEGPIFKKQEYNSKLKGVWWGVDKFKSCCFFKKFEVLILDIISAKGNVVCKIVIKHNRTYQLEIKFRLSQDMKFDLRASKILCENLGTSSNSDLKGYVHNICLDPFGFLLMSEIQIKIWKKVSLNNPIWYFDATGSVH